MMWVMVTTKVERLLQSAWKYAIFQTLFAPTSRVQRGSANKPCGYYESWPYAYYLSKFCTLLRQTPNTHSERHECSRFN